MYDLYLTPLDALHRRYIEKYLKHVVPDTVEEVMAAVGRHPPACVAIEYCEPVKAGSQKNGKTDGHKRHWKSS